LNRNVQKLKSVKPHKIRSCVEKKKRSTIQNTLHVCPTDSERHTRLQVLEPATNKSESGREARARHTDARNKRSSPRAQLAAYPTEIAVRGTQPNRSDRVCVYIKTEEKKRANPTRTGERKKKKKYPRNERSLYKY